MKQSPKYKKRFPRCFICGEVVYGWQENYCMKHESHSLATMCTSPKDWATILEMTEKGIEFKEEDL